MIRKLINSGNTQDIRLAYEICLKNNIVSKFFRKNSQCDSILYPLDRETNEYFPYIAFIISENGEFERFLNLDSQKDKTKFPLPENERIKT